MCIGLTWGIRGLCGLSLIMNLLALFFLEACSSIVSKVVIVAACVIHSFIAGLATLTPFMIYNTIYVGSSLSSIFGTVTEKWLADSSKEAEIVKENSDLVMFAAVPLAFLALVF